MSGNKLIAQLPLSISEEPAEIWLPPATTSIVDFTANGLGVMGVLAELYLTVEPSRNDWIDTLIPAAAWVAESEEHGKLFDECWAYLSFLGADEFDIDLVPQIVQEHIQSIKTLVLLLEETQPSNQKLNTDARALNVTYSTSRGECEYLKSDMRMALAKNYHHLCKRAILMEQMQYGRKHVIRRDKVSTSLILEQVNLYYLGAEVASKEAVYDYIVSEMFLYYWIKLFNRATRYI